MPKESEPAGIDKDPCHLLIRAPSLPQNYGVLGMTLFGEGRIPRDGQSIDYILTAKVYS